MRRGVWGIRIPTVFALLIVFGSIWITSYLIQRGTFIIGKASPDITPRNITITNITDTSFAVVFTTSDKTVGAIQLNGNNPTLFFDDRDKSGQTPYYSHQVTVSNLKSKTTYFFSILSNNQVFQDQGKDFTVNTADVIAATPPQQKTLSGKILLADGSSGTDVVIIVQTSGSQLLSGVTVNTGDFLIPIRAMRISTLDTYFIFHDDTEISLDAIRQEARSHITILYKDASSIPTINLSKDYNFIAVAEEEAPLVGSQLQAPSPKIKVGEIKILTPSESQSFIDLQPQFRGIALPKAKVKIIIQSSALVETEVITDKNGIWILRPSTSLPPGEHTITIETTDSFGILKRFSRKFTIFAAGSQVAQIATPSATPIVTASPTPTTSVPATTPTLSPTPTVTLAPSLTPAPTRLPTATITKPGSVSQSLLLTFLSVLFILTGTTLLFIL